MNGDVTLLLIRHAKAGKRGPDHPNDSQRPLTEEGRAQARKLARLFEILDVRFDHLFSSPYTRALQTAEALGGRAREGRIKTLQSLTGGGYPQLLVDIATKSGDNGLKNVVKGSERAEKTKNITLALVGHEPYLGEFTSYLLTADAKRLRMNLKKAGVLTLRGRLEPGGMILRGMLEPALYPLLGE